MTQPNKRPAQRVLSVLGTLCLTLMAMTPLAKAQSLVELYESALAFDASYQSAKLQHDANLVKAEQAKAAILPTAGLAAAASRTTFDNTNPSVERSFSTQNATLSASQPLYRLANWLTYEQSFKQIEQAKAQLDSAEQDLVVRTSQAYFDVLSALDTLAFVSAQKAAVAEQLASAKRNFDVGTSTITDAREAQARYDLVGAQEISADNDLRVKKIALDQLVGKPQAQPKGLSLPLRLSPVVPLDVNAWVQQSEQAHPNIRLAQSALSMAELEVKKAEAGHKPTLDLVASYNLSRSPSGSAQSTLSSRTTTGSLGLQFNLPLFAGFSTQNRIRETLLLKEKAANDLEGVRRTVALITRTAYFGLLSGQGQVKALEAAELSSQSALEANKLGYKVGVRINIDVLNSQSQLFQTKRDLAQARYNVLLGGLRLRQANGTLRPQDLRLIDDLLIK